MNISNILKEAVTVLESCGLTNPRLDAEVILASLLRKDRAELYSHPEMVLSESELVDFRQQIKRRKIREPVAYIVGRKEFWSLTFEVNRHVLVPRPETEILVEEVLRVCRKEGRENPSILEIGTGCGAISVALVSELKKAQIVATDFSQEAIAVALRNALINSMEKQISFLSGNLFQTVSGRFDFIVSNPPYISKEEYDRLPLEVRGFEPESALLAGTEGTEIHREIIQGGASFLKARGWLLMEIGAGRKDRIENMLKESHLYDNIAFREDYAGIDRVAIARRVMKSG